MSDTSDVIINRMLLDISDTYDKSEGSFFYDSLKPVSIELESSYAKQDEILNNGFAKTATGEYLDKKVAEQGITRKPATKATTTVTITGIEGALINIGDRVASDLVEFLFTESKTVGASGSINVLVECEEVGSIGNVPVGAIKYFPVTLSGLNAVTNTSSVTNGYNGETDDELRQRYFEKVQTPGTSGNIYHYRNWAKEVVGVGDARVVPLWNGAGTVKVIIIDANKTGAEQTLIDNVAEHIEENRPIGASVTVISATELPINISATLTIDTANYTLQQVTTTIETNIINYLKDIAFVNTYVSYANIGNIIFTSQGVLDYSTLLVNAGTANITIDDDKVAVIGTLTIN